MRGTILFALLLTGCATVGHNFDSTSLSWLKTDATRREVLGRLGPPLRVGSDAGVPTWTYGYYQYRVFGDSNNKDLIVRFTPDGHVKSYTLNTTFPSEKAALDPSSVAAHQ